MYNDEPPDSSPSSYRAHAKGVLALNSSAGFWLLHSVPKFPAPPPAPFVFPHPEQRLGQSAFCLTLITKDVESCLAPSLMLDYVDIYSSFAPEGFPSSHPNVAALLAGQHTSGEQGISSVCQFGLRSHNAWIFSKTRSWGKKLFRDLVQPYFKEAMAHQSWRSGRGGPLDSCCPPRCLLADLNIASIKVNVTATVIAATLFLHNA